MNFAYEQEAQDFLAANPDIELFGLFILGANGVPRDELLYRNELLAVYRSDRPLPNTTLGLTMNGEDIEDSGLAWDVGDTDCRAYPLSGSLVHPPWRQISTTTVQVSMYPNEGLPVSVAGPHHLLVRTISVLKNEGYHPMMTAGLEFYLLDRKRDANGRPQPARDADDGRPQATQVYGLRELEQIEPFLTDLHAACKAQGLPIHTAISECTPDQMEITLDRGDVLVTTDQAIRYERLAKSVTHKHGMLACFMAKPFGDLVGTGMHPHVSLVDEQDHNLSTSDDPADTPLLRQAVGGALASLLDLLLLFCPNVSSYRHFQTNSYAPLTQTWSVDNHTVGLCVPGGSAPSRHIEYRIRGTDTNPYLVAVALLTGVHCNIHEGVDPGVLVEDNDYAQAGKRLPTDWLTALGALQGSEWAREAFDEPFPDVYLMIKRAEYRQSMDEVSE